MKQACSIKKAGYWSHSFFVFLLTLTSSWSLKNGSRTEWSLIRSVIIRVRVINKIGQMRNASPICLITSMITDRIGRHEVLLPIIITITKFVIF